MPEIKIDCCCIANKVVTFCEPRPSGMRIPLPDSLQVVVDGLDQKTMRLVEGLNIIKAVLNEREELCLFDDEHTVTLRRYHRKEAGGGMSTFSLIRFKDKVDD